MLKEFLQTSLYGGQRPGQGDSCHFSGRYTDNDAIKGLAEEVPFQ